MGVMSALHLVLAVLLAGEPEPAPSWQALDASCTELRKTGAPAVAADACRRAFDAVPDGPQAPGRRSLLLGSAHALYKKAQTAGPDLSLACADAAMLRAFAVQLDALPPGARPGDRDDLKKALGEVDPGLSARCSNTTVQAPPQPPRSALTRPRLPAARPDPHPADQADIRARPRRPLRVAGGTILGLGIGLGAAMIGVLVRGADLRAEADAMRDETKGNAVPMGAGQQYDATLARGSRTDQLALGLGITAAALIGMGVGLLVVDRRRGSRRLALTTLALPTAGVRLSLEF